MVPVLTADGPNPSGFHDSCVACRFVPVPLKVFTHPVSAGLLSSRHVIMRSMLLQSPQMGVRFHLVSLVVLCGLRRFLPVWFGSCVSGSRFLPVSLVSSSFRSMV